MSNSLPIRPIIPEAVLVRGERPYPGDINPGDVFAWEPDLPYARELVVVTFVDKLRIGTRPLDGDREVFNDIDRFREAVVQTRFNPMPTKRNRLPLPIPPDLFRSQP